MKTWSNTDKTKWDNGPWMNEPDKAQWVAHGLDCLIVRGPSGALCGYVGVPESHSAFNKPYYEVEADVHGGLTFSDKCRPHPEGDHRGICHVEDGAANKEVWWLGFDCAHAWDICPAHDWTYCFDSEYRDFEYVKTEVERLAAILDNQRGEE